MSTAARRYLPISTWAERLHHFGLRPRRGTPKDDLSFAGILGHVIVVVVGPPDQRRVGLHTTDLVDARDYWREHDGSTIYVRTDRGWREAAL